MAGGSKKKPVKLDEIGPWTEVKLDIVRKYARAYTRVLSKQPYLRKYLYIDAFAGAGTHISKLTGEMVKGSPLNALLVDPPFHEFHFIDIDGGRAQRLKELSGNRQNVHVYEEDCNDVLLSKVFPRARYEDFSRALCLLDPYALNLKWEVLKAAGESRSIEIFLNFMVMDVNMNVLKHDPSKVDPAQAARFTAMYGNEDWRKKMYRTVPHLFGESEEKYSNAELAAVFRERLKEAGFNFVPEPLPMKNSTGAIVYYLYFASPNKTGASIVKDIFSKYR